MGCAAALKMHWERTVTAHSLIQGVSNQQDPPSSKSSLFILRSGLCISAISRGWRGGLGHCWLVLVLLQAQRYEKTTPAKLSNSFLHMDICASFRHLIA